MDSAYLRNRKEWHLARVREKADKAKRLQQEIDSLQEQLYKHEGALAELEIALEDLEKVATQEEKSLAGGAEGPAPDSNIISLP